MNLRTSIGGMIIGFAGSIVWAAVPPASSATLEVLSLPEANRLQVALSQKVALYPELIHVVQDSKQSMAHRWNALSLAAAINSVSTLPVLTEQISSPDWYMRNAALIVAEKYFPEKANIFARKLLTDKALVIRSAAVDVLGKNLSSEDRDLLWAEFSEPRNRKQDQSLWIRGKIAAVLAKSPLPREAELFRRSLAEDDLKIKVASIKALEKIHGESVGVASDSIARKAELWKKYAAKASSQKSN